MRKKDIEEIIEILPFIPDENLPLLKEAGVLLTHLTPPWCEKNLFETPLIALLKTSMKSEIDPDPASDVHDGFITAVFYDPTKE